MKRLDIVNAKLKKLYDSLFDETDLRDFDNISRNDLEKIKNEIRKYEEEKTLLYYKNYNARLKEMPWLVENETYKQLITYNAEFDFLFIELIHKCPSIVTNIELLMPIAQFINKASNKIAGLRELLSLNRNVLADSRLLSRINDKSYPQIKNILKSITLMSNQIFREYLAQFHIQENRTYDNVLIMENAFKEDLNLDFVLALGSKTHINDYFHKNMSKELLDQIANAKTKRLKKQILAMMFGCFDEKTLNILVRFFEIEDVRDQLLDEKSFYYALLIKPLYEGISHKDYGSIDKLLSTCSNRWDDDIFNASSENINTLAHIFDSVTGPYLYYHKNRQVHKVPVYKFTKSFNNNVDKFYEVLDILEKAKINEQTEELIKKYDIFLYDDLKDAAVHALLENEDLKMSDKEIADWNDYISTTYDASYDELFDNNPQVTICYGLDSFEKPTEASYIYSCFSRVIPSPQLKQTKSIYNQK